MQRAHFLRDVVDQFRKLKDSADRGMAQVSDEQFFAQLDEESNSIAMNVKHVAGNLRSRWTDFLDSEGEKATRDRDQEFVIGGTDSRESLLGEWEAGWEALFEAVEELAPADLDKTIGIRGEPHTVIQAIVRGMTHTAYHVGQIVLLAKHAAGTNWHTLTIPRGKSAEFFAEMQKKHGVTSKA